MESLSDVSNPWKGVTMTRCLVLALVVLLVSSGVQEVHEAVDSFVDVTGISSFADSWREGSLTQGWGGLWWWGGAEEVGAIRRRKKPMSSRVALKTRAQV